jgi:2,3-bisphosphoglycerate-independent phosphoglycerate mutase
MKYALIIPDGAADEPQGTAGGVSPLEAARTPAIDQIAQAGVVGRADHVPRELQSGSDVGIMSLMGYDPLVGHTGRAPIEAAAQGIELNQHDWAIRCNLVTVSGGRMQNFTAGHVDNHVAQALIGHLQQDFDDDSPWQYYPGVSYRNLLVHRPRADAGKAMFSSATRSTPPHDLLDLPIREHLPTGPGAASLCELMDRSRELFAGSDVDSQATQVWFWGLGPRPGLEPFVERFGKTAAVVTAVDVVRGLGGLMGLTVIEVEGATGYLDTDYAAKGRAAVAALKQHDLVVVHVEATDEASHDGNAAAKIEALERIDECVVRPIHQALVEFGEYRILVSPDHPTLLRTRTHAHGHVPIAACGTGLPPDEHERYDEVTAGRSSLVFDRGCELMPWFLGDSC